MLMVHSLNIHICISRIEQLWRYWVGLDPFGFPYPPTVCTRTHPVWRTEPVWTTAPLLHFLIDQSFREVYEFLDITIQTSTTGYYLNGGVLHAV